MSLAELIAILENRLAYNAAQRTYAVSRGDLALVQQYDADTATTQDSLAVLRAAVA